MSIADKLITIADNTSAVAEAVDESRTTITALNSAVRVDDVYNDGHALKCYTSGGATVDVYGKNLLETASVDAEADKNKVLFEGMITGDFVFSCLFNYSEIKTPTAAQFEFMINGAAQYMTRGTTNSASKKINGTLTRVRFLNWGYGVGTVDSIQLEVGTVATEYEDYQNHQHGVSTGGMIYGLATNSPTMTIVVSGDCQAGYFSTDNETYAKYKQLVQAENDLKAIL